MGEVDTFLKAKPKVAITLTPIMLEVVDWLAQKTEMSRSATIERLLEIGLKTVQQLCADAGVSMEKLGGTVEEEKCNEKSG